MGPLLHTKWEKCFKPKSALKNVLKSKQKHTSCHLPWKWCVWWPLWLLRQFLARINFFSCDDIMTTQRLCTGTIQCMKCKFYTVPNVKEEKFSCWFTYTESVPPVAHKSCMLFCLSKEVYFVHNILPTSKSVKCNVYQYKKMAVHSKNFLQSVVCAWVAVVRLCTTHIWKYWRSYKPLPSSSWSSSFKYSVYPPNKSGKLRWTWRPQ
jgi:hypothetical protein